MVLLCGLPFGWAQPWEGHCRGRRAYALGWDSWEYGLADFCPTSSHEDVRRCRDALFVITSLPVIVLCPRLPSLGSGEMRRRYPWAILGVMGLGVSPLQQGSLTHLLSLLPAEGEVRRRGSGTLPSGLGRLKKQK